MEIGAQSPSVLLYVQLARATGRVCVCVRGRSQKEDQGMRGSINDSAQLGEYSCVVPAADESHVKWRGGG